MRFLTRGALPVIALLTAMPMVNVAARSHWDPVDGTCGFRYDKEQAKEDAEDAKEGKEPKPRVNVTAKATVTAMDGSTWTIDHEGTTCTLAVSDVPGDRTHFFAMNRSRLPMRFFTVGDLLLVDGTWTRATNTIDARRIWNLSERLIAVYGRVESATDDGWMVAIVGKPATDDRPEIPSATIEIVPFPETRFFTWGPYGTAGADRSVIEPGHILTVRGIWDPATGNFAWIDRIKDLSVGLPSTAVVCNFGTCTQGSFPTPPGLQ